VRVRNNICLILAFMIVFVTAQYGFAFGEGILQEMEEQFISIVDAVSPAVVEITATKEPSAMAPSKAREDVGTVGAV